METSHIIVGASAVITACVLYVARAVLVYLGKSSIVGKYDAYKPYAVMAANWVEGQIPDDYGTGEADSKIAKGLHKLDQYLKKFADLVKIMEGNDPNPELIEEAKKWATELAKQAESKNVASDS